ncbi:hypothetical protein KSS87_019006 [Heliosperma pusillum]|nr:hypothetical protein KSS87_019006 [Heliosperma pusillum]
MAKLFHSYVSIRFASTLKMHPSNSRNNLNTTIYIIRNPLTIKYRPQNINFAGGIEVKCPKYVMRCHADLRRDNVPKHVAIILDGSRRWFKAHDKPLSYEPFFEANLLFADLCIKWGILTATAFIYSIRNMERGKEANDLLLGQLEIFLEQNIDQFMR